MSDQAEMSEEKSLDGIGVGCLGRRSPVIDVRLRSHLISRGGIVGKVESHQPSWHAARLRRYPSFFFIKNQVYILTEKPPSSKSQPMEHLDDQRVTLRPWAD